MALPFQKQEAFLSAHVRALDFFGRVPKTTSHDNLTAATARALRGDKRREIDSFVAFPSHYLFASHLCSPQEPREKGQMENLVGYIRRNRRLAHATGSQQCSRVLRWRASSRPKHLTASTIEPLASE